MVIKLMEPKIMKDIVIELRIKQKKDRLDKVIELNSPSIIIDKVKKEYEKTLNGTNVSGYKKYNEYYNSHVIAYEIQKEEINYFKGGKKEVNIYKFYTEKGIIYYDSYEVKISPFKYDFGYKKIS